METKYRLTYFDITGLAECIRYLFSYGKIPFEDVRVEPNPWLWRKKTEKPMYGLLPILEINGKMYNQSVAISRYLAKKLGLTGKSDLEDLDIDGIVETQTDFRLEFKKVALEEDEKLKAVYLEKLNGEIIPFYFTRFEDKVKENGGFFVGGRLTWADIHFVGPLKTFVVVSGKDFIEDYPNLKKLRDYVHSLPGIKEWIETNPCIN